MRPLSVFTSIFTSFDILAGEEEEKKKRKKKKKKGEGALAQTSADEAKEQEMEAEPSERKRKRSAAQNIETEISNTLKTPAKQSDKKRRRSQTGEGSEAEVQGEMPSKMKRTSEGQEPSSEKKDVTESDMKGNGCTH